MPKVPGVPAEDFLAKPLEDPLLKLSASLERDLLITPDALADIRNTGRLLTLSDTQILRAASLEVGREIANLESMTSAEGKTFAKELRGRLYAGSRSHVSWLRNNS